MNSNLFRFIVLIFLLLGSIPYFHTQKVGLVLSGGGALGMAHIGVIKALEENNIPIDYITGTSAGALVGGFYASGYSPQEMEAIVESENFLNMAFGNIDEKLNFYFKHPDIDPTLLQLRLDNDLAISKAIPTNFTNSALLDFEFMRIFSGVSAKTEYNFDNLFVPFRCVAADIALKTPVVFNRGHLNQAIRASMTYPGYLRPIRINGQLMFDGGLYNNFPTDVMYNDFFPDIIIGVNLSDSTQPPDEDDVLSQLKSMVINRSDMSLMCENGILISPSPVIGTFDFDKANKAVQEGYNATMAVMDEIKALVQRRKFQDELTNQRKVFRKDVSVSAAKINLITVKGVNNNQAKYIKNALIHNNEIEIDFKTLKKRFFRLLSDEKIKTLYPLATYDEVSRKYSVNITVVPQKPIAIKFGGIFSSRPINTGFFGVSYQHLGKIGVKLDANVHFGKFYGSTSLSSRIDFNTKVPFYIKPFGVLNNWDYFKSFATFFDESKPSYIVQKERFAGIDLGFPAGNKAKIVFTGAYGNSDSYYYQNNTFTNTDTSDFTRLDGGIYGVEYIYSTLNRKLYSTKGHFLKLSAKVIDGMENSIHGNTSSTANVINQWHQSLWLFLKAEKYFVLHKNFRLGGDLEVTNVWTNTFFNNHTATLLYSPIYQPFPESKTLFYTNYASHSYIGLGAKIITPINDVIDLRGELYLFRPNVLLKSGIGNQTRYDYNISYSDYRYMASIKLVINSVIGPLTFAANYYDAQPAPSPWNLSINYGYILQNRRFIKP